MFDSVQGCRCTILKYMYIYIPDNHGGSPDVCTVGRGSQVGTGNGCLFYGVQKEGLDYGLYRWKRVGLPHQDYVQDSSPGRVPAWSLHTIALKTCNCQWTMDNDQWTKLERRQSIVQTHSLLSTQNDCKDCLKQFLKTLKRKRRGT